jgi:hypothetical protein
MDGHALLKSFVTGGHTKRFFTAPVWLHNFNRSPHLYTLFALEKFARGVEVGVRDGGNAAAICAIVPGVSLLAVDPYESTGDDGDWQGHGAPPDQHAEYEAKARARLKPFDVRFMRMTSAEAALAVEDRSLDFAHIDGNHSFDYVMEDLILWSRRVRSGGIISAHDYVRWQAHRRATPGGVTTAVDAFVRGNRIDPWFICGEMFPTAFWVNP